MSTESLLSLLRGVIHAQETCTKNLHQKLVSMHVTKTVRFDWSAVFENFWYKKLAPNRAALYSVEVSGTLFLSVCLSPL